VKYFIKYLNTLARVFVPTLRVWQKDKKTNMAKRQIWQKDKKNYRVSQAYY